MSKHDEEARKRVQLRPRTMYLLNQSNQAVRTQLEQELRNLNLTGIQYMVLSIVGSREGVSSAELSRCFFVTPQTMNEIVNGLQRRGLLKRKVSSENRRVLTATLTSEGQQILQDSDAIADRIEAKAFSGLPEADFKEMRRILSHLLSSLRDAKSKAATDEGEDNKLSPA